MVIRYIQRNIQRNYETNAYAKENKTWGTKIQMNEHGKWALDINKRQKYYESTNLTHCGH